MYEVMCARCHIELQVVHVLTCVVLAAGRWGLTLGVLTMMVGCPAQFPLPNHPAYIQCYSCGAKMLIQASPPLTQPSPALTPCGATADAS